MTFAAASDKVRRPQTVARWATVVVGATCSMVAWFVVGADGSASAAVGTVIVVGFFWSGTIPVVLTDSARLGAGAGLALLLLSPADFVDRGWLGGTVIACALTWTAVHVGTATRGRRGT
jgi:hypothetical protein